MRIRLTSNEHTLFLDLATIESVELIRNVQAICSGSTASKRDCLLSTMDKTKTAPGKRSLRRNLLEPPAQLKTITARQAFVAELSRNETAYRALVDALSKIPDLEAVLASLLARESLLNASFGPPKPDSESEIAAQDNGLSPLLGGSCDSAATAVEWTAGTCIAKGLAETIGPPSMFLIRNVIAIKTALKAVPQILSIVEKGTTPLSLSIAESLRSPALANLETEMEAVLEESLATTHNTERMRMQGAFAIRPGRCGHLDVARKTLSENIEDMHAILEKLRGQLDTTKLALVMNARRGYHFTLPSNCEAASNLGDEFIQIQRSGKLFRFSTDALIELNSRVNESLAQIWTLTDRELADLLDVIWSKDSITALHSLCDSVAILDMLSSFVSYCSVCPVRTVEPSFTIGGPIALKNAHHPMLLKLSPQNSVHNDLFLGETSALHVITGRNQSGKSTFLRMVALMCILAHTGCALPAEFASMRVLNRIHTRCNNSDDISASLSHHSKEMQEIGTILRATSRGPERPVPHSLVLIDELGRATNTTDGFSIAYAVAEKLATTPNVLTLFTTHFSALGALQYAIPVIHCFHLATSMNNRNARDETRSTPTEEAIDHHRERALTSDRRVINDTAARCDVTYRYKVTQGTLQEESYGIEAAQSAGVPLHVTECAKELRQRIPARRLTSEIPFCEKHFGSKQGNAAYLRTKNIVRIAQQLSHLRASLQFMNETELVQNLRLLQRSSQQATRHAQAQPDNI